MRIIDTHLHVIWMKGTDVLKMSMGGVEAAIMPTPHALPWMVSGQTLIRMWNEFLDYWVSYCKARGIELYSTLSVPFTGIDTQEMKECLKELPKYLENKRVVGVGEIGINNGTEEEVQLFETQLSMAKENNLPVIVHTPAKMEPQVVPVVNQIISIILEHDFPMERVVLDHTAKNTLETRLRTGAMVGLSVCYDKNTPDEVATMVMENRGKRKQLFVNSELGYDNDGYYSVPRAVLAMRMAGLKREEIEEVTWDNPKKFFNLTL